MSTPRFTDLCLTDFEYAILDALLGHYQKTHGPRDIPEGTPITEALRDMETAAEFIATQQIADALGEWNDGDWYIGPALGGLIGHGLVEARRGRPEPRVDSDKPDAFACWDDDGTFYWRTADGKRLPADRSESFVVRLNTVFRITAVGIQALRLRSPRTHAEWSDFQRDGQWLTARMLTTEHRLSEASLSRWARTGCTHLNGNKLRRQRNPDGCWVYSLSDIRSIVEALTE